MGNFRCASRPRLALQAGGLAKLRGPRSRRVVRAGDATKNRLEGTVGARSRAAASCIVMPNHIRRYHMRQSHRFPLMLRPTEKPNSLRLPTTTHCYQALPTIADCDLLPHTYNLPTTYLQPTTYHLRPTTHHLTTTTCGYGLRPTTYGLRPATYERRHTAYGLRPTAYYRLSTTNYLRPALDY